MNPDYYISIHPCERSEGRTGNQREKVEKESRIAQCDRFELFGQRVALVNRPDILERISSLSFRQELICLGDKSEKGNVGGLSLRIF